MFLGLALDNPVVVVSLTAGAGIVSAVLGKLLLDRFALEHRLRAEHRAEERSKLRALIGTYHGPLLEAALDWNRRMHQMYNGETQHLGVIETNWRDPHQYFFRSCCYRFLALFALARRFETEAFFIDSRISRKKDFSFVKFTKAFLWVMTSADIADDTMPAQDHFLNDDFRPLLDKLNAATASDPIALSAARSSIPDVFNIHTFDRLLAERLGDDESRQSEAPDVDRFTEELKFVLRFFSGLGPDEIDNGRRRFRWDRLVALHLFVMAFINDIGYPWQRIETADFKGVAQRIDEEVLSKLTDRIPETLGFFAPSRLVPRQARGLMKRKVWHPEVKKIMDALAVALDSGARNMPTTTAPATTAPTTPSPI
jgi:hypothetical protein